MPRLFVAADPTDAVREELARYHFDLRGIRWLPPEQFHLTLRFLGDVPTGDADVVAEVLDGISGEPAEVKLEGIGLFPSPRRPRVLVARLSEVPELHALQTAIESTLVELGFAPEDRPFTSHITLARLRDADTQRLSRLLERAAVPHGRFLIDAFSLYESRLFPSGAQYTRLRRYALTSRQ